MDFEFIFSDKKEDVILNDLMDLYKFTYWATDRTKEDVVKMLENTTIVFSIRQGDKMVGFARMLTDFVYKATLWDVVITPELRGKGLGKRFVEYILNHPKIKNVPFIWLYSQKVGEFYLPFGFKYDDKGNYILRR